MDPRESLERQVTARLDGPHDAASVLDAAAALGELSRLLNRATRSQPTTAPDVATVLGELAAGSVRLDQLLGQLASRLAAVAESPSAYDDRSQNPRETAEAAIEALQRALPHVDGLTRELDLVHEQAAYLGCGGAA